MLSPVHRLPLRSLLAALIVLFAVGLATSPGAAQFKDGSTLPAPTPQVPEGTVPPPFPGPGPTAPGLYVGIKDRDGVAVSWVRVGGLKDGGELVPYVRGTWGKGIVNVPLVEIMSMEFYYSAGKIQTELRLLTGENMHLELLNPYTQLEGWWRDNPYSIPLSSVRIAWFRYVQRTALAPDRYNGPTMKIRKTGVVRSVELHGTGGFVVLVSNRGETLDLRFDYQRIRTGEDLVRRKAPWVVGRTARVIYVLSATRDGYAHRELQEIELVAPHPAGP